MERFGRPLISFLASRIPFDTQSSVSRVNNGGDAERKSILCHHRPVPIHFDGAAGKTASILEQPRTFSLRLPRNGGVPACVNGTVCRKLGSGRPYHPVAATDVEGEAETLKALPRCHSRFRLLQPRRPMQACGIFPQLSFSSGGGCASSGRLPATSTAC